jgi:preprotein translocase subunit SecE
MESTTEVAPSRKDTIIVVAAVLTVVAGLVAFYALTLPAVAKLAILLASFAVAAFIAYQSAYGREGLEFVKDARKELRKVTWPTLIETRNATLMIGVVVVVTAIILGSIDALLGFLVSKVTKVGG